jgi:hypothetical protein
VCDDDSYVNEPCVGRDRDTDKFIVVERGRGTKPEIKRLARISWFKVADGKIPIDGGMPPSNFMSYLEVTALEQT